MFLMYSDKLYTYLLCLKEDGVWKEWQAWTECSTTCGGGERTRVRECTGPFHGGAPCPDPATESEVCGTALCPSKYIHVIRKPGTVLY